MAKHDVLNVSYMRKDSQFLADGTWYVTTPCLKCGLVDEEVPWEQAKTPHHAGIIADQRHAECGKELDEETRRATAAQEIEAAKDLRSNQARNLQAARDRADASAEVCRAFPGVHVHEIELEQALRNLKRHEHAMLEAEKRVADTIASNKA